MGTGSLERSLGAAELPFSALRAVENDLGRLVAMLVAAEVRLPALLLSREPDGLALNALAEQSDALGAHRPSLHTESWPCKSELCSPRLIRLARQHALVAFGLSAGALAAGPVRTAYSFGVRLGRPGWRPRPPRL